MRTLNLLEITRKLSKNEQLTTEEMRYNDRMTRKSKENGFPTTGQFSFETRRMKNTELLGTHSAQLVSKQNDINRIVGSSMYLENCKANIKVPFVTADNVAWGYPTQEGTTEVSRKLTPHRLSTCVDLSLEYVNGNSASVEQFQQILSDAIFQKLLATVFSGTEGSEEKPSGLLTNETQIATLEDLAGIQYEVDRQSDNGIFVISPTAKQRICKMGGFKDGKLLDSDYITTNLCEDGKIAYLDLGKLVIVEFGISSLTVDNVTKKADGMIRIVIESYFDFDIIKENYIKTGMFAN